MLDQNAIKEFEDQVFAPYAMKSHESRGRRHAEPEHPYRSAYQRDRDRIIHSAAFRRLVHKTQVFVTHEGDYYRTRLTHTLEAAQIARTIATTLRLNSDLTEAITLAHDLGHTPFGHSGEDALNELMAGHGGFNHNMHGLRVVEVLEVRYPQFPGLNLTWEVREGIVKHSSAFDTAGVLVEFFPEKMPSLETQIVDIADEIAYDNHDLDDGLTSGLLREEDLERLPIWAKVRQGISREYANLAPEIRKHLIIRTLINAQVTDLIEATQENIRRLGIRCAEDVRNLKEKVVAFSPRMAELRRPMRELLVDKLYHHYRVIRMSAKAKRFIIALFTTYVDMPEALPTQVQDRLSADGVRVVVCDYIAGMTDRYALDEYKKLFEPYEKV